MSAELIKSYPLHKRLLYGLLPALLIHLSIGSVYAWTMLVGDISKAIGSPACEVHWAFSLAIFFLGMSAALGGKLSERNLTLSAGLSTFMFISGLIVAGFGVTIKSQFLLILGYGCIMGIGLGVGYMTPIKNVMLWFPKSNGMAIGSTILGFGFSGSIAALLINWLLKSYSPNIVLYSLAAIYLIPMVIGTVLIKRPDDYVREEASKDNNINSSIKDIFTFAFIIMWMMMLLNITAGLAIIGNAKQILLDSVVYKPNTIISIIFLMGIFNGAGRLLLSSSTDSMKKKYRIYYWIFGIPVVVMSLYTYLPDMIPKILLASTLMYGAGFSCLPIIIKERFGIHNLSVLHGSILTAWGIAGLIGNNIGEFILNNVSINALFHILTTFYISGTVLVILLSKDNERINKYKPI